jgi:cell division protein FtsN
VFGKKKDEGEVKEQKGELKEKVSGKPPKVSKGFGNTIILFIVFFIVFTVIVTGVAFFADKLDLSGAKKDKNLEDIVEPEKVTDPNQGEATKYVMDENGDVNIKTEEEKADEELKIPSVAAKADVPAPKPAPLPPVVVKPEAKKPEPKPAPKPVVKKEPVKKLTTSTSTSPLEMLSKKATTGPYVVQVASFKNVKYAEAERDKLRKILPEVFVVKADLGEKGIWYRVRCYNGISYQEAKAKAAAIAKRTSHKPYPMKK